MMIWSFKMIRNTVKMPDERGFQQRCALVPEGKSRRLLEELARPCKQNF